MYIFSGTCMIDIASEPTGANPCVNNAGECAVLHSSLRYNARLHVHAK